MLKLVTTGTFRKDYKRIKKRGYDISLLETVLEQLLSEKKIRRKIPRPRLGW